MAKYWQLRLLQVMISISGQWIIYMPLESSIKIKRPLQQNIEVASWGEIMVFAILFYCTPNL